MLFNWQNQRFETQIWTPEIGVICDITTLNTQFTSPEIGKIPHFVLGVALGARDKGYHVHLDSIASFLNVHRDKQFVMNNAATHLAVLSQQTGFDFDPMIRSQRLWDLGILYRLLKLATIGEVPEDFSLAQLSRELLKKDMAPSPESPTTPAPSHQGDSDDRDAITIGQCRYAVINALTVHRCFQHLLPLVERLSPGRYLSHKIQLMGEIALEAMSRRGINIDFLARNQLLMELETRNQPDDKPLVDCLKKLNQPTIRTHFNSIVKTGRTSSYDPNLQGIPGDERIRRLFIPTPEHVLIIGDYHQLELCTLAQVCLGCYGTSRMAELINDGVDLHRWFASQITGKSAAEITEEERRCAKACNFGFPGGLGADAFVERAANEYGINITVPRAAELKELWLNAFPEMQMYLQEAANSGVITRTGRIRANTKYCAARNTPFQGLAADGAKVALYRLNKFGIAGVNFVHDEIISEVPRESGEQMRLQQQQIMEEAMRTVVPDVAIRAKVIVADYWQKP